MALSKMFSIQTRRERLQPILALLLVGGIWLLLSPIRLGLPPVIRIILILPLLFLLPGYLLQHVLFQGGAYRGLSGVPLAFALSLGVGALAWGLAHILGDTLEVMVYFLAVACTALIAWNVVSNRHRADGPRVASGERHPMRNTLPYLLLLGVIFYWIFVTISHGALFMAGTDNWYYLAIVRRIAQTGLIAPGAPYFPDVADPGRGGPWVALVALASNLSDVSPTSIWEIAPALLVPIAVLAYYLVGLTLFEDLLAAAISCFFLLYGFGRFTWDIPMMLVSPAGVGFVLFLVALALVWRFLHRGERPVFILALLTAWALASIHLLIFAGLLAMLGIYTLFHVVVHRDWSFARRALLLIAVPALLAIPFIGAWTGSGPQTANPIYADEWGLLSEFTGWHIVKPSVVVGSGSSPWTWAFLLLPVLVLLAKRRDWALFLLSTMLFVIATAFNPLFVEPLLRLRLLPPWGIWRMALQVFQFQFVLGGLGALALVWLYHKLEEEWGGRRLVPALLLTGSVSLAFLPSAVPLVKPMWQDTARSLHLLRNKADTFPFNWAQGLEFLQSDVPDGSVILTDANTGFFISALSDPYVVSIPYGHSSPFVDDDEQRRQDTARALDPETDMEDVLSILDRYQVDFVLLSLVEPPVGVASLSPDAYARLQARFAADPDHFEPVFAAQDAPGCQTTVFAYHPVRGGSE